MLFYTYLQSSRDPDSCRYDSTRTFAYHFRWSFSLYSNIYPQRISFVDNLEIWCHWHLRKQCQLPPLRLSLHQQLRWSYKIAQTGNQAFTCLGLSSVGYDTFPSSVAYQHINPSSSEPVNHKTLKPARIKTEKICGFFYLFIFSFVGMVEIRLRLRLLQQNSSRWRDTLWH